MADEIWRLPYSAQQLQNAVTNQVPRINAARHWERWDISTGAWVDTGILAQAKEPVYGAVTLTASGWTDDDPLWSQVVNIAGVTENSVIDLRPTAQQLADLSDDNVVALTVENNNGVITVYAVGACPSATIDIGFSMTDTMPAPMSIAADATPSYRRSGSIATNVDALYTATEEE